MISSTVHDAFYLSCYIPLPLECKLCKVRELCLFWYLLFSPGSIIISGKYKMCNKYLINEVMSCTWANAKMELNQINNRSNSQEQNRSGDPTFSNSWNIKPKTEVAKINVSPWIVLSVDTSKWDVHFGLHASEGPSMLCHTFVRTFKVL